jgi:hypothetical protein
MARLRRSASAAGIVGFSMFSPGHVALISQRSQGPARRESRQPSAARASPAQQRPSVDLGLQLVANKLGEPVERVRRLNR